MNFMTPHGVNARMAFRLLPTVLGVVGEVCRSLLPPSADRFPRVGGGLTSKGAANKNLSVGKPRGQGRMGGAVAGAEFPT